MKTRCVGIIGATILLSSLAMADQRQHLGKVTDVWTAGPAAAEGKKRFEEKCARCHGPEGAGIEHAPALRGNVFRSEWDGKSARELYKRIISTMPQDDPGSLEELDVIQLTAFVASLNQAVLPAVQRANDLNTIKLELTK